MILIAIFKDSIEDFQKTLQLDLSVIDLLDRYDLEGNTGWFIRMKNGGAMSWSDNDIKTILITGK